MDEALDLFEPEDDVAMMGDMNVSLLSPVNFIVNKGIQRMRDGTKGQGLMEAHERRDGGSHT